MSSTTDNDLIEGEQKEASRNFSAFDSDRDPVKQQTVPFDGRHYRLGALVSRPNLDMPLLDAVFTRRTVRSYREEPVPFDEFEKLIELSMHAPTSCNEQRWKVIYIDDSKILNELYMRGSAAFLKNKRQAFLLLYNNHIDNVEYRDDIQSGAAFITTFSLLAHSVGVGSCWICHLPNKRELRRMFGVNRMYDPIALVSFGYYREKVKVIPRKKGAEQLISRNTFDFENLVFEKNKNVLARRIFRWCYYRVPAFLRRKLRRFTMKYEKKFYFEVYD